jgi:ketosteroid isomerase-like protein
MKKNLILIGLLGMMACGPSAKQVETWKQEITITEKAFSDMAGREGIPAAFVAFADDSVAVLRGNKLVKGKNALKEFYGSGKREGVTLSWSPDFVEVASSGDLGYTYGKYIYTSKDSLGNKQRSEGIFHTVWKRQPDGSWKFVWD